MLEQYFRRRHVVTRLRAEPLGHLLEEFAVYLHNRGHSTFTVQGYLWATDASAAGWPCTRLRSRP